MSTLMEGTSGAGEAPEFSDAEIDQLVGDIETPSGREIPMTQPESEAPAPAPAAVSPAQEFEITVNGQKIKAPVDKVTQWASQGYDYAQKMQAYKQQLADYEAKQKSVAEMESRFKPIDEYIKQNPEWWNHVLSAYQQQTQAGGQLDPANPLVRELQNLKGQLNEVVQFKTQAEQEKAQLQRQQEDQKLLTEIESIRKEYPDLDLAAVDQSGKSLEQRVLEHAVENGIKSFKSAFRDFNHDQLVKRAEERAKETVQKDLQRRTKQGLLGKTPAPTMQLSEVKDLKNQSYESILDDIKQELGIA